MLLDYPRAGDTPRLVELFAADLDDLRLPIDRTALASSVGRLLERPDGWFRVGRTSDDAPPDGVLVAHAWESVKFAGPAMWIETLYVAPTARRCGLGRLLVDDLLSFARSNGFAGIDLESYRMNAPASYLYRSLGFRRIGRERYSYRIES